MSISPAEFFAYEAVILTEQMPAARVISFLAENPEFADWYAARSKARQERAADVQSAAASTP